MYKHASMNKVYRIVWNEALSVWQAVGEWGSGSGKVTSLLRRHRRAKRWLSVLPVALMALNVWANPTGMDVISGSVQAVLQGNILNITNSDKAVIHWQQFNIGVGETTNFIQPSATSSVLNRVVTANPSQIMGNLTSNGQVYLINPSGILVGKDAQIDVAAFVASTLNISDANFIAGVKQFGAESLPANLTNLGEIRTPNGGQVYLLAGSIDNQGNISAPNGDVIIAAGQQIQLTDTATPGVSVLVPAGQVNNLGKITADAGRIGIAGAVINNTGSIRADSVVSDGGKIRLVASSKANISGEVSASGSTKGGKIDISAPDTTLTGAIISAEGADGGQIRIGGEYQGGKNLTTDELPNAQTLKVDKDTVISVNATSTQGKGGTAVLWSDKNTTTQATVKAKGGVQGQGGLVEVSSGDKLIYRGNIENSQGGQVLFDPKNIIVGTATNTFDNGTPNTTEGDTNTITATSLTAITNTGAAVTLKANNDIRIDEAIASDNTSGKGGDITLQAGRSIFINANITTDNGHLTLKVNDPSAIEEHRDVGTAQIIMNEAASIDTGTGDIAVIRGGDPETPIPTPEPVAIIIGQVSARNLNISSSQGDEEYNTILLNGKLTLSGNLAINEDQNTGSAVNFYGEGEDANLITGSLHINAVRTSFARNTDAASAYIITQDLQFEDSAQLSLGTGNATIKKYGIDEPNWLGSIGSFVGEIGHIQTKGTVTFDAGSEDISILEDIIHPKYQSLVLKTTGNFTLVSSYDANISGDNAALIRIEANTISIGDESHHGNLSASGSVGNIELVANNFFFNNSSSVYSSDGSIRLISKTAERFDVNQSLVSPLNASNLIFESLNDLKLYSVETSSANLSVIANRIEVASNNTISSQTGNISLLGKTGGVSLLEGSKLKTTSGDISVTGTNNLGYYGVDVHSSLIETMNGGSVLISGIGSDYGVNLDGNTQLSAASVVINTNAFRDVSTASGGVWGANTNWQLWLPTTQNRVYVGNSGNYSYSQLNYDYTQYGATYGDTAVLGSGKGILFAQQASITEFPLSLNKVYDGNTSLAAGSQTLSLGSNGSVNLSWSSGEFAQRHVGNNIGLVVTGLSGSVQDANNKPSYGYSFSPTSITGSISQRESVAWTGLGGDNNWFNATNWQGGALPDGANVASVFIPNGVNVLFNSSDQTVYLDTINSTESKTGGLTLSAGKLSVTDMYLDQFTATGGNLVNSRLMTRGDINILFGSSNSPLLSSYIASSMTSETGNVSIETYGGLATDGLIQARNISLTTHSPLVIGDAGLTASEAVDLNSPDGDISIAGNITANSLTANARNTLSINPMVRLTLASSPSLTANSVSNLATIIVPTQPPTEAPVQKPQPEETTKKATDEVTKALTPTIQTSTLSATSTPTAKITPLSVLVNAAPSAVPALPAGFSAGGTEADEFGAVDIVPSTKQTTNEASSGNQQGDKTKGKGGDKKQEAGESVSDNNASGKGRDKKDKPVAACVV